MKMYELDITIISAENLKDVRHIADMKTYAVFWVDPNEKYTTNKDAVGGTNPVWDDRFKINVAEHLVKNGDVRISIEIYTDALIHDKLVGSVSIPLDVVSHLNQTRYETCDVVTSQGKAEGNLHISYCLREKMTSASRPKPSSSNSLTNRTNLGNPSSPTPSSISKTTSQSIPFPSNGDSSGDQPSSQTSKGPSSILRSDANRTTSSTRKKRVSFTPALISEENVNTSNASPFRKEVSTSITNESGSFENNIQRSLNDRRSEVIPINNKLHELPLLPDKQAIDGKGNSDVDDNRNSMIEEQLSTDATRRDSMIVKGKELITSMVPNTTIAPEDSLHQRRGVGPTINRMPSNDASVPNHRPSFSMSYHQTQSSPAPTHRTQLETTHPVRYSSKPPSILFRGQLGEMLLS